ncbi:MAG: glycosyltransferase family 2 protein [Vulcanimicrobiaceae bacterium]
MLVALCVFVVFVNSAFAVRSLMIARRSRARLEVIEVEGAFPTLSIVVPARNEERQIERCVRSLLAQAYPDFEVIVVDDCSEDETRAILDRIALEDERLTVVAGEPLPEGWIGKPWALEQGMRVARGVWLLSTDADTEHEPCAAGSAVVYALKHGLDALSLLTDQTMIGAAERLVLPSILWTIAFAVGGLDDINDPQKPDVALFNGQYVLMSRLAYEAIGGYTALRGEVAEDLELARLLKRDGRFTSALVGAEGMVRTRMYRSFAEIWNGFVKNFALGARGNPFASALGLVFLASMSPASPAALCVCAALGQPLLAFAVGLAMLCAALAAEYGMMQSRFPRGSGWTIPVGLAVLLAIFVTSLLRYASGRGVCWRGRHYA